MINNLEEEFWNMSKLPNDFLWGGALAANQF